MSLNGGYQIVDFSRYGVFKHGRDTYIGTDVYNTIVNTNKIIVFSGITTDEYKLKDFIPDFNYNEVGHRPNHLICIGKSSAYHIVIKDDGTIYFEHP